MTAKHRVMHASIGVWLAALSLMQTAALAQQASGTPGSGSFGSAFVNSMVLGLVAVIALLLFGRRSHPHDEPGTPAGAR